MSGLVQGKADPLLSAITDDTCTGMAGREKHQEISGFTAEWHLA
jgi:hypothetical protein